MTGKVQGSPGRSKVVQRNPGRGSTGRKTRKGAHLQKPARQHVFEFQAVVRKRKVRGPERSRLVHGHGRFRGGPRTSGKT